MRESTLSEPRWTTLGNVKFTGNLCKCDSKMDTSRKPLSKAKSWESHHLTEKDSEKKRPRQGSQGTDSRPCHLVWSVPPETARSVGLRGTLPLPQAEEAQSQLISVTHHNYRPLMALAAHQRRARLLGGGLCHKVKLGPQRGSWGINILGQNSIPMVKIPGDHSQEVHTVD